MKRSVALLSLLGLAACLDAFRPDTTLELLDKNESQWHARQLRDYDFDYSVMAFAPTPPVSIEVRNGLVTRVVLLSTGADLPVAGWPTVDSLFVWTRRDLGVREYKIDITFDESYHFPSIVSGDIPNAVDDEFTRRAENLREALTIQASR